MMKKTICSILCGLFAASLCAFAWAAEDHARLQSMTGSGMCGEDISWDLDAAGDLTITGTGDFYGEDSEDYLPWRRSSRYIVSVSISGGVESIPDGAFRDCDYLESVTLDDDVKIIGQRAFAYCTRLEDIDLDGVKEIGAGAFCGCGLGSVDIPDSVTTIGEEAFCDCEKSSAVRVGDGVSYLDRYVFGGLSSLETVTIPATVTAIDEGAFSGSYGIHDVYYAGTSSQWDKVRGGGTETLERQAWTIHFESTRPDDAAPMTFQISNVQFYENEVKFSVKASIYGIKQIYMIVAYLDENGQFVDMSEDILSVAESTYDYERWLWDIDVSEAATAKVMFFDVGFAPIIAPVTRPIER